MLRTDTLEVVVLVGAAAAVVAGLVRVLVRRVFPAIRSTWQRFNAALDTVVGRPPIVDPVTSKVIAPELPPLGHWISGVDETLALLVQQNVTVTNLQTRVGRLEDWREQMDRDRLERIVTRAESARAWEAVAEAQRNDTGQEPEVG